MPRNIAFKGIPESFIVPFSEGVIATLEELGYNYLADETSPPVNGECEYRVLGVEHQNEQGDQLSEAEVSALWGK
jgi:hypothetical protein